VAPCVDQLFSLFNKPTAQRIGREVLLMKKQFLFLCLAAVASLSLAGCTTETTTTTQTTTDPTTTRVHTQEELRKSGQSETGAALEKSDAAIRTSGPR
jgi:type IV pilus biogenesis protein CpaD/CtpE